MPDMDGIAATEQLSAAGPDRRGRDDVGPGRGGLPPPLDARRGARVPRQAVQQRRADRLDPPGLHAGAREAEPDGRRRQRAGRRGRGGGRRDAATGEPGQVVAVFSPKGGVGRTTIAVNLAVAAATELGKTGRPRRRLLPVRRRRRPAQPEPEEQVDRRPRARARGGGELESLDTFVINHSSGIRVLLAPPSPEMAELITPSGVRSDPRGAAPRPTTW